MQFVTKIKKLNWHYVRAGIWPTLLPIVYFFGWTSSVFLVLCLSLYANFASDLGAAKAAEAEKAIKNG